MDLLCGERNIGQATGFFLKQEGRWFIITNWHVLAGRNPLNGQPNIPTGATPDKCRFYTASLGATKLIWTAHVVELGDPLNGNSNWLEHPTEGQHVDIGVLPLAQNSVGEAKDLLDPTGNDPNMFIDLGGELFLPGYPLGISAAGKMAIWKRGSLASSLEFGEGITRSFYVDTATREGMSGAPCLAIANWHYYAMDHETNKVSVVNRPMSWRLLGVYSGRKNPSDGFEAQLGLVWREKLIFEILSGKKNASVKIF